MALSAFRVRPGDTSPGLVMTTGRSIPGYDHFSWSPVPGAEVNPASRKSLARSLYFIGFVKTLV